MRFAAAFGVTRTATVVPMARFQSSGGGVVTKAAYFLAQPPCSVW
jgi:hypothetical protein